MLYEGVTWALTRRLKSILYSLQQKMLFYIAVVALRDRVSSLELLWCGVRELGAVLSRLRWFGYVVMRDEMEILGTLQIFEVPERRPPR